MAKKILIISREFPPKTGGVGDHTKLLANILSKHYELSVLTGSLPEQTKNSYNFQVVSLTDQWSKESAGKILEKIKELAPELIFFQYTAQMYQRFGFPFYLIDLFRQIKQLKIATVLILHELFSNYSIRPLPFLQAASKHYLIAKLTKIADLSIVSTLPRYSLLQKKYKLSDKQLSLIPIPSNIELIEQDYSWLFNKRQQIMQNSKNLLFSSFGTLQRDKLIEQLLLFFSQLLNSGINGELLFLGDLPRAGSKRFKLIKKMIADHQLNDKVHFSGKLSAVEVSDYLSASDCYIMLQKDGISTRSGTIAAALQHSLPIIANRGPASNYLVNDYPRLFILDNDQREQANNQQLLRFINQHALFGKKRKPLSFYQNHLGEDVQEKRYCQIIESLT